MGRDGVSKSRVLVLTVLASTTALMSCSIIQPSAAKRQLLDEQKCISKYGAPEGTPAYASCVQSLNRQREMSAETTPPSPVFRAEDCPTKASGIFVPAQ